MPLYKCIDISARAHSCPRRGTFLQAPAAKSGGRQRSVSTVGGRSILAIRSGRHRRSRGRVRMQPKDQPFPKYAHDYFGQLREQYQLVLEQTQQAAPPSIAALMQRAQTEPEKVSWSDVFALETAYLYAIPQTDLPRLREELKIARDRYRDVVGSREFASYLQTVQGDVTKVAALDARAELLALAERLRYLYTFVPPKESVRNAIGMQAAILTFVAALIGVGVWAATEWWLHQTLFTIVIVLFVGEMGGFVSVQQRLNSGPTVDPLFKELQLTYGWFSVVVIAPITGAIFAIVLYFVFVGGLLSGGLFPEFGPPAFASSAAQRGA